MNEVLKAGSELFVVTDFARIVPIVVSDVIAHKEFSLIYSKPKTPDDTFPGHLYDKFYQNNADLTLSQVAYATYDDAKKAATALLDEQIAQAAQVLASLKTQKAQLSAD